MAINLSKYEIPPEELRWECPSQVFEEMDSNELELPVLGQERAMKSLRLGLDLKQPGYHVFVSGFPGTGRHTAVRYLIEQRLDADELPNDWCYVYNFKNPNQPVVLAFPAGKASEFKKEIDDLIQYLVLKISSLFSDKFFAQKRNEIIQDFEKEKYQRLNEFENQVSQQNLSLKSIQTGAYTRFILTSVGDDNLVAFDDINITPDTSEKSSSQHTTLPEKQSVLARQLSAVLQQIRQDEQTMKSRLNKLERDLIMPLLLQPFRNLMNKYPDKKITTFLTDLQQSILNDPSQFLLNKRQLKNNQFEKNGSLTTLFEQFRVNVVLDNSELTGRPVIYEEVPTLINLFGTIERVKDRDGNSQPSFLNIRSGSILRANGGFLVVNLSNLSNLNSFWLRLKQVLKTGLLPVEPNYYSSESPVTTLRPEPIPVNFKVILIGEDHHYYHLFHHDNEFAKIFKIRADFDVIAPKNNHLIQQYIAFIHKMCQAEDLLPFQNEALALLVEEGVRLAGWRTKLSTEMSRIADLAREANYWAETDGSAEVTAENVATAIQEMVTRANLYEERILERFLEGYTLLSLSGKKVGQINSLVIREDGDYQFGKPNRLTAVASVGRSGIINIERDSDLSGRTHTKGIAILKGYFRGLYAQEKELNFTASLCFEQSYSRIDGDSASSAEVYALLSSLGNVPIRQDIAVTGSINQFGEIQPIGGVNEKIEGFFRLCQQFKLTGEQGVIIPSRNLIDLQLSRDVVQAVKDGQFHIYAIDTVDEGLEILSGLRAGKKDKQGKFPEKSFHYLVDRKLHELNRKDKDGND